MLDMRLNIMVVNEKHGAGNDLSCFDLLPVVLGMKIPEYKVLSQETAGMKYELLEDIYYYSERYDEFITVPKGYLSDGASGPALDIHSRAWWVHDWLCDLGTFDSGKTCTVFQAAMVLGDILRSERRLLRSIYWQIAVLFGCSGLRKKNGWI